MSHFDALHPALQHHIVNSLEWRELRPFQEAVIPAILAGKHLIIVAPTAGGKTEAAFFPVLSRMLSDGWTAVTRDGSLSAHFEHTVVVTSDGREILTLLEADAARAKELLAIGR